MLGKFLIRCKTLVRSGTVPSQGFPHVSSYPTFFLWQSQVDGPRTKSSLTSNVSTENNKTVWTGRFPPPLGEEEAAPLVFHITSTYDFMTGKTLLLAHLCPPLARAQSSKIFLPSYSRDTLLYLSNPTLSEEQAARW